MTGSAVSAAEPTPAPNEIVVRGFKQSLITASAAKRGENGIVEVIDAEDIADFPDMNLAEALQRVPGVAIDRDGGEGRQITIRGLPADFTRVRINGIEALATTGGKDQASGQGGANRSRGFDFQLFASELFKRVTVRKTPSAEREEGALGASVELRTALPFDFPGLAAALSAEIGYNDLSRKADPRLSGLVSGTSADGKLGALLSVAFSKRRVREEGASSGRWENPSVPTNSAGCFQSPGPCDAASGSYSAVNSAWHARIPRYGRLDYDWQRLGLTAALQARPSERSLVTLTGLYAHVNGTRQENYLEIISLARGGSQANRQTDVRDFTINGKNELIAATFDDVDVRSEERFDILRSSFLQLTLQLRQEIGDRLTIEAEVGQARSVQNNPVQTTVSLDRYDSDNYSYDFSRNQKQPTFLYGFDVTDPANWSFSSSTATGDASLIRLRPNRTTNRIRTARIDAAFALTDRIKLKAGALAKRYKFATSEQRRFIIGGVTDGAAPLPAGVTLADISHLITGIGRNLGVPAGTPTSWLAPDNRKLADLLGIQCNCINQYGDFRVDAANQLGGNRDVRETDISGYFQVDFDLRIADMPLRGNIGARYAHTKSIAGGFASANFVRIGDSYGDILPAANFALEPSPDIVVRLGLSKQMVRPPLASLTPGGSISNTGRTLSVGNPKLRPIRAKAVDINVEWYPRPDTQLVAGFFYKKLSSYIQNSTVTVPFGSTGLPSGLLANGNTADTLFQVSQFANTKGGNLQGFEIGGQHGFHYLPAPFDGLGVIANFTRVTSKVAYILDATTVPPTTVVLPLAGLSRNSWNATIYYERGPVSARLSGAYRSRYLSGVPAGNGNDARGKLHSFTLDSQATLELARNFQLTIQALNLTDVLDNRWIDLGRMEIEESTHTGRQFFLGVKYSF